MPLTLSQPRLWRVLVFIAVPLASFLSFSVQPVVGKYLVPWHGGSASTWIGTMLFFQTALVGGYLWAYWIGARTLRIQVVTTVALAIIAAVVTLLPPPRLLDNAGMGEVLLSLTVAMLPAMVLLFGVGLLLQAWIARLHGRIPYYLYSVSNAGSLCALVIYPIWIEPNVGLGLQSIVWRSLLVILAIVVVAIALGLRGQQSTSAALPDETEEDDAPALRKLAWLGLSALTCVCMLGATRHLSAEIGSNPLSWIIPLGLYLASFSIAFSGWWRESASLVCLSALGVSVTGFLLLKGVRAEPVAGWIAFWLIAVVGTTCLFGNGLLYALRPRRRFLQYYVVIGVGGVIGGMFSSLSAPNLFSRDFEFLGSALLLLIAGVLHLVGGRNRLRLAVAAAVVSAPFIGTAWVQIGAESTKLRRVHHVRNLYGHLQVVQSPGQVILLSETTTHGSQQISPESARRRPTLYYIESSGVGTVLSNLQKTKPQVAVGVVGLGAGTLATYARSEDTFTFWDLDPKVIWVAQTAFSYLADARGKMVLVEDDGRKAIEKSREAFDLIVIDAFSGDSIPAHLLTIEAFEAYLPRLAEREGVLLIHASNRHIELYPVIAANARALGWEALRVHTAVSRAGEERDLHPSASNYIVVHRAEARATVDAWFAAENPDERVARTLTRVSEGGAQSPVWTDDRNSILDALNWKRYFDAN